MCSSCAGTLDAVIHKFDFTGTNPGLPLGSSLQKLGSQIELVLDLDADEGFYTIEAFRNNDLTKVVSSIKDFEHDGGNKQSLLKVPLLEGENEFFLRIIETSLGGGLKTTSTVGLAIERDLEFRVASVRLNHIEGSNQSVPLYTNENLVTLFYTINGTAENYEVSVFRNFSQVATITKQGPGNYSEPNFALETNELNVIQLKVRSLDISGSNLGFQQESNIITLIHDDLAPNFLPNGISATFQTNPPAQGSPWGPTDLASIGLLVETDQPNARVVILNTSTGDEIERYCESSGRLVVAGIELPKDPSLGPLGITTTTFTVNIFDEAGNLGVGSIDVERLSLEPCFALLKMEPFDDGAITAEQAINVLGSICEEQKPHRVVFSLASRFSENSFFKEEQLSNLMGGDLFSKDISIPIDALQPNQNIEVSVQAKVFITSPIDPKIEIASSAHDLGVITLDRKPPLAPSITTEQVVFATNSPSLTIDGLIERQASVDINVTEPFIVRPAKKIKEINRQFRGVLDLGFVGDGEYVADITQRDRAGNIGLGSSSQVILKYDRQAPEVKSVRVNNSSIQSSRPFYFNSGDTISIQVLMDEYMAEAPKVWITQQGGYGLEAGLSQVISEGFEYEYQYVVMPSLDGELDGPVEILVSDGRDNAGNPISPAHRETQAFIVDTLAPVLFRRNIIPADGSIISSAPAPLRLVMREHPDTKGGDSYGSGPNPAAVNITAFGPIESEPNRVIPGRLEVFGPRTVDFYPDPEVMNLDGTYLFQISMKDQVGNEFIESVVLSLDQEKLSTNLILKTTPTANLFYNYQTLPRSSDLPEISLVMESSLTSEMQLTSTQVEVRNYLRRPQLFTTSQPFLSSSSSIRLNFQDDVLRNGDDDGVFTVSSRLKDTAGNLSDLHVFSFYYDSQPPQVMDGKHFPVPDGFTGEDYRFPADHSVVKGPLNLVSALIFDKRSPNGFLGSGVKTSIESSGTTSTTTIILSLIESFASQPTGEIVTGTTKFKGDLTQGAPLYGGPSVSRVLYEINVDEVSQEPLGLPTDGSYDGIYRMDIYPVDMSDNRGDISTSFFLYDTQQPIVSIDVLNEVWVTSGVVKLSGNASDVGSYPLITSGYGSTKGSGVRTVEIRIDAVNKFGSATFPAVLDWTPLNLDKDPLNFKHDQIYNFGFDQRLHGFEGRIRITARAIDAAGNIGLSIRDVGLDEAALDQPVLVSPNEGTLVSGGIQTFRWNPVPEASGYSLQLIDSNQTVHSYSYEAGTIQAQINLDQLPNGLVVWKVIAIDGVGHESPVDNGRSLTIDRQRPSVLNLSVQDPVLSPDNEGRILKAQVRVHIKFSELIDPGFEPELNFIPASKTYFNSLNQEIIETYPPVELEIINIESDQLTAMFSLEPVHDSADYNGIGRIVGSNYRDLSGLVGEPFELDFELDLGPYFDLRVFSNPILEQELVFIIKGLHHKGGAVESISETPYVVVRQSKNPGNDSDDDRIYAVTLNRLNQSTFQGTYPLNLELSGSMKFEITGTDLEGNRTTRIIPFQVSRLQYLDEPLRNSIEKVSSQRFSNKTTESSAAESIRFVFPWNTAIERQSQPWNIFPRKTLARSAHFKWNLSDLKLAPGKYGIMELEGNGDQLFISKIGKNKSISFSSRNPHNIYVLADDVPPAIEIDNGNLMKLEEDLSIRFIDSGVGLDPGSIHLALDSRKINNVEVHANNELELSLDLISSRRSQQILIKARDYLGNAVSRTIQVQAAGPVKIRSALVVPNPNYGNGNLQVSFNRAVQAYDLGLYDSSGSFISRFSGGTLNANGRISLEPLLTSDLANGVYLLKLKVTDSSNRTDRKIVKFIILR